MPLSKNHELWIETIRIIPSLAWILLAGYALFRLMPFFIQKILPKLSSIKVGDVEIALEKFEMEMGHVVEIAEKNSNWKVHVPENDKKQVIRRIKRNQDILKDTKILMFDDRPETLKNERRMLKQLGIHTSVVRTLSQARNVLMMKSFDLLISDIHRPDGEFDGIDSVKHLQSEFIDLQAIFYIGVYEPDKGVPACSCGITNRPDELVHLILDVLEREKL